MPRRYRRRLGKKAKYSIEQTYVNFGSSANWTQVAATPPTVAASLQDVVTITDPTDLQGMRKVKHFDITFSAGSADEPVAYALVYVPDGRDPLPLLLRNAGAAGPLYLANQDVIACGVLDFTGGPCRIRSHLARNLNSGDRIYLLVGTYTGINISLIANIRYAITLQ